MLWLDSASQLLSSLSRRPQSRRRFWPTRETLRATPANLYTSNLGGSGSGISNNHGIYGVNGGYNVSPYIAIIGEYGYSPLFSQSGDALHAQLYGGGARFNLNPKSKVVGYGVFTVGGDKFTESVGESKWRESILQFFRYGGRSLRPVWRTR
jgi:hypothetical protein